MLFLDPSLTLSLSTLLLFSSPLTLPLCLSFEISHLYLIPSSLYLNLISWASSNLPSSPLVISLAPFSLISLLLSFSPLFLFFCPLVPFPLFWPSFFILFLVFFSSSHSAFTLLCSFLLYQLSLDPLLPWSFFYFFFVFIPLFLLFFPFSVFILSLVNLFSLSTFCLFILLFPPLSLFISTPQENKKNSIYLSHS